MAYTVVLRPAAQRQLRKLQPDLQRRLVAEMEALAPNPRPPGCKKLAGANDLYRIRAGDYRIVYQIADRVLIVEVVKIGHRSNVYE